MTASRHRASEYFWTAGSRCTTPINPISAMAGKIPRCTTTLQRNGSRHCEWGSISSPTPWGTAGDRTGDAAGARASGAVTPEPELAGMVCPGIGYGCPGAGNCGLDRSPWLAQRSVLGFGCVGAGSARADDSCPPRLVQPAAAHAAAGGPEPGGARRLAARNPDLTAGYFGFGHQQLAAAPGRPGACGGPRVQGAGGGRSPCSFSPGFTARQRGMPLVGRAGLRSE